MTLSEAAFISICFSAPVEFPAGDKCKQCFNTFYAQAVNVDQVAYRSDSIYITQGIKLFSASFISVCYKESFSFISAQHL